MLTATVGKERVLIEEGIYQAVCIMVIDMGIQYNEQFDRSARKVRFGWQIPSQTFEVDGKEVPRVVSKEFTLSLSEKSKLRPMLQSWRGKEFTPEELQGFDVKKTLGAGCQVQIIHRKGNSNTYANVETVLALPRGTKVPVSQESLIHFDFDDSSTYPNFELLPRYIQETIAEAENFGDTGLALPAKKTTAPANPGISASTEEAYSDDFDEICIDDDLPF